MLATSKVTHDSQKWQLASLTMVCCQLFASKTASYQSRECRVATYNAKNL
jgi:ribosomal protein L7Ae-like RNA K-turn-binding protein